MPDRYFLKLEKIKKKKVFTVEELAYIFNVKPESARVIAHRYCKKGIFIRIKRDLYILKDGWERLEMKDYFFISNFLQVPSYISLITALSYYEVTTQVIREQFESVCIKRTKEFLVNQKRFIFHKIKKELYFDFLKEENFFIAKKEKAFIDAVYLYSFGKYRFDIDSIDIRRFDRKKLKEISLRYPERTREFLFKLWKI